MTVPPFLFHGSCKGIDGDLSPRLQRGNINGDFPEGEKEVVFATHDQDLAAIYTLKTEHMLSAGTCNGKNYSFFRDYDNWIKQLNTSACNVYVLPSNTFKNTISKKDGNPTVEWQSSVAVTPIKAIHHTPETVMQTGAQLFFLDHKIKPEIWHYDKNIPADKSFMNRLAQKVDSGILPESFNMFHIAKELIDAGIIKHLNSEMNIHPVQLDESPYSHLIKDDISWLKNQMNIEANIQRADGKTWTNASSNRTGRTIY